MLNNDYGHNEQDDFDSTRVYNVGTDELSMTYWNSSNGSDIDHSYVLLAIVEELMEDEGRMEGSVTDNWNEILFEIKEL